MALSVKGWEERLAPRTFEVCEYILNEFLVWLRSNGGDLSNYGADELIEYQKAHPGTYEILDLVQQYVRFAGSRVHYKVRIYSALRSFFSHNRCALPEDPGFVIRSDVERVKGSLKVEDLRAILTSSNPLYRAVFLSMFMGGMGIGEIMYWSDNGLESIRDQLNRKARLIQVDLPGRKKARNKRPYHTFIGRDGIEALKVWMGVRSGSECKSIFFTQFNTPITQKTVRAYWMKRLRKAGIVQQRKGDGFRGVRYGKNLHEMRDLFRTRWELSEVKDRAAENFMGHQIDNLEYNKAYSNLDYTRGLYSQAEPWLNILSEEPEKMSKAEHERRLSEIKEAQDKRMAELEAKQAITNRQLEALMESLRERGKLEDLEKEAR